MLNISMRQIRTLLAVRKNGKISSAANALGLTSPAVTIQLRQLEAELGTQLFLRTRNGAVPTESGEIAIEIAQNKLRELNLSLQDVADILARSSVELPGGGMKTTGGEILVRVKDRRDLGRHLVARQDAALARRFQFNESHQRLVNGDGVIWTRLQVADRGFANGSDGGLGEVGKLGEVRK